MRRGDHTNARRRGGFNQSETSAHMIHVHVTFLNKKNTHQKNQKTKTKHLVKFESTILQKKITKFTI